jgi:hypothetical protein
MKSYITAVLIFLAISTQAQNLVGGQMSFDSDRNNLGLGVKGVFGLSESLSFSPDINYFLRENKFVTVNTDLHLNLSTEGNITIYGLGGLNFGAFRSRISTSSFLGFNRNAELNLGVNLGMGMNVLTKDNFRFFAEGKYIVSDISRVVLSFGVLVDL